MIPGVSVEVGPAAVVLVEVCFGLAGSGSGWGALVAGAFAILSFLLGAGAECGCD